MDPRVSTESGREIDALTSRTGHLITFFKETQALEESSRFLELHPARLNNQRVTVLGRGLPDGSLNLSARHAEQMKLGRFEVVPGTTHFLHLDAPERVVAAVQETVQPRP